MKPKFLRRIQQMMSRLEAGDFRATIKLSSKILKKKKRFALAWWCKGFSLHQLERHKKALVCFDHVIQTDDTFIAVWALRGHTLNRLRKYQEAIMSFERALQTDPKDIDTWMGHGLALHRLARQDEALISYDKALDLDPNRAVLWAHRALLTNRSHLMDYLAIESGIGSGSQYTQIVAHHALRNRHEEALKALQKTLEADRPHKDAIRAATTFFLCSLLSEPSSRHDRQIRLKNLAELYVSAEREHILASALHHSVHCLLNTDNAIRADEWLSDWDGVTRGVSLLANSILLLHTALLWKRTQDWEALLRLPAEERAVLEGILKEIPGL